MTVSKIPIKKVCEHCKQEFVAWKNTTNTAHINVIAEPIKANEDKNEYSELRLMSKRRKSKSP